MIDDLMLIDSSCACSRGTSCCSRFEQVQPFVCPTFATVTACVPTVREHCTCILCKQSNATTQRVCRSTPCFKKGCIQALRFKQPEVECCSSSDEEEVVVKKCCCKKKKKRCCQHQQR